MHSDARSGIRILAQKKPLFLTQAQYGIPGERADPAASLPPGDLHVPFLGSCFSLISAFPQIVRLERLSNIMSVDLLQG